MIALDLAELVGSAIALQLLFGLPLAMGNHHQLFLAAGILGATVMPHNLYLHSSLVKTRQWPDHPQARHLALRLATADMVIALAMAFLVNAAILVLAGGAFHGRGLPLVTDLGQAYRLLTPMLGTSLASLAFGVALLAAGQSSTITGTLAGQVVMEGFLDLRLPLWQRRLLTRGMALIPALVTVLLLGEGATNQLLVLSEVVLSL
jgi:manganese transport protein